MTTNSALHQLWNKAVCSLTAAGTLAGAAVLPGCGTTTVKTANGNVTIHRTAAHDVIETPEQAPSTVTTQATTLVWTYAPAVAASAPAAASSAPSTTSPLPASVAQELAGKYNVAGYALAPQWGRNDTSTKTTTRPASVEVRDGGVARLMRDIADTFWHIALPLAALDAARAANNGKFAQNNSCNINGGNQTTPSTGNGTNGAQNMTSCTNFATIGGAYSSTGSASAVGATTQVSSPYAGVNNNYPTRTPSVVRQKDVNALTAQ